MVRKLDENFLLNFWPLPPIKMDEKKPPPLWVEKNLARNGKNEKCSKLPQMVRKLDETSFLNCWSTQILLKMENMKIVPNCLKWRENRTNTVFGIFRPWRKITLLKDNINGRYPTKDDSFGRCLYWRQPHWKMT